MMSSAAPDAPPFTIPPPFPSPSAPADRVHPAGQPIRSDDQHPAARATHLRTRVRRQITAICSPMMNLVASTPGSAPARQDRLEGSLLPVRRTPNGRPAAPSPGQARQEGGGTASSIRTGRRCAQKARSSPMTPSAGQRTRITHPSATLPCPPARPRHPTPGQSHSPRPQAATRQTVASSHSERIHAPSTTMDLRPAAG